MMGFVGKCNVVLMQPIPLPKEAAPKSVPIVHLEVEHKPGSKFWPYKELKGAALTNISSSVHCGYRCVKAQCISCTAMPVA
jgi:hypothetical protein